MKETGLRRWVPTCGVFGMKLSRRHFVTSTLAGSVLARGQRLRAENAGNLVEFHLEAAEKWLAVGGRQGFLYAYNGTVPGPLLEVSAGDTLRVQFRNSLPEETNLHFHGLHAPPSGNADNSFLMVGPGETRVYQIEVPANHPSGTFWIHPHIHGKTARQVSRGLAMPLVVRGGLEQIPEIGMAPEVSLVIQDFNLDAAGYPVEPQGMSAMQGRQGGLVTTNGGLNPTIPIAPGGLVRLHLLNASSSKFYTLVLEGHPLLQVASSGGALPTLRQLDRLSLAPGERAQVLVSGVQRPGSYRLTALGGNMGSPAATLTYTESAVAATALPEQLVPVHTLPPPERVRSFVLGESMSRGMGMGRTAAMSGTQFTINGLAFDPARVDTTVKLGDVEDWEFINPSMMAHPMHIHTNPFQLVDGSGNAEAAWRDIAVAPAGGRVRVRMQFLDYPGKTFYHCHILDHEDLGMMGILEIVE